MFVLFVLFVISHLGRLPMVVLGVPGWLCFPGRSTGNARPVLAGLRPYSSAAGSPHPAESTETPAHTAAEKNPKRKN